MLDVRRRSSFSAVTALCLLGFAGPSTAATSLFVASDPGDPVGRGRHRHLLPPAYTLSAYANGGQITLNVNAPNYEDSWSLTFAAPAGTPLVAGAYENAQTYPYQSFNRPGLLVSNYGASCSRVSGRFQVLAATITPQGQVQEFAASFEQHCESATPKLTGLVRFSAGDPTCAAGDGTSCEDHDACTAAATCVAGQCVGSGAPACAPANGECEDDGVCDPTAGTCLPPASRPEGAVCDDRDACSLDDRCRQGVCGGSSFAFCYPGNDPCIEEVCEPSLGCSTRPAHGVCGRPGVPATLLFLQADAGELILGLPQLAVTAADGSFSVTNSSDGALATNIQASTRGFYLTVNLAAAGGQRLQPGRYEPTREYLSFPASPSTAILNVSGLSYCTSARTGSFTILEAAYTPGGRIVGLAADFSLRCPDTTATVRGSLRYRAGEAACQDAADGTACEDHNACTPTSRCVGGACVAPDATGCAPGDSCHEGGACDPSTGSCSLPAPRADGMGCRNEAGCVPEGYCQAGACVGFRLPCDDDDLCTDDRCDAGQCVSTPIAGRCWTLEGSTSVQWASQGKRCSCTEPALPEPVVLYDEGSYRMPIHGTSCAPTLEAGRWSRKRTGRLGFTPGNDAADLVGDCYESGLDLKKYTSSGTLRRNNLLSLRRVRKYTVAGTRKVAIKVVTRLKGRPTGSAGFFESIRTPPVTPECYLKLNRCLFGTPTPDEDDFD
jgi:hypothetical protein